MCSFFSSLSLLVNVLFKQALLLLQGFLFLYSVFFALVHTAPFIRAVGFGLYSSIRRNSVWLQRCVAKMAISCLRCTGIDSGYLWITLGQQVERFWVGEKYGNDAQCKCPNAKTSTYVRANANCEQYDGKLNEMEGSKKVANVNGIIWRRVENDCAQIKTNKIIKMKLN